MRRREFLTTTVIGTTMAMLHPWVRHGLAFTPAWCVEDQASVVRAALDRARHDGKPLIVFVVPENEEIRGDRASSFATLIDLGPDRALAILALGEVVCAPLTAVRCVVPDAPLETGEAPPSMLVVEAKLPPTTVIPHDLHDRPPWQQCLRPVPADEAACLRRETRRYCERLVAPLRRTLLGPGLRRRARWNARVLGPEAETRVRAAMPAGVASLPPPLVDAAAPLLFASAVEHGDRRSRDHAITALAAAARRRLRDRPPPGARWVRAEGCNDFAYRGADDEVGSMGCGLASVPHLAARFLVFATRS
jgi:hypothetical protein